MYFWINGCPSMQQSGLSLLLFCVPLEKPPFIPFPPLPLRLESTLLGVKDLLFILLGFPRLASLRDRSPELSEPLVTRFPNFFVCAPPHSCVHSRFAEQINIRSSNFFLPRITLESISYTPGCRVTRRMLSHRYATSLDETACASFHLKIRKLGEELFFRSFHRN